MKILDVFNVFKKKNENISEPEFRRSSSLPEDLERFRVKRYPAPSPEPEYPSVPEPQFRAPEQMIEPAPEVKTVTGEIDKMDLILQRLETIDTRLKLIEERTRK
jgi:hypothetical protein